MRGGSWNNHPRNCRSAYRNNNHPDNRNNNLGFRVCCLPQHPSTSEPGESLPLGAQEGSRPAPVIGEPGTAGPLRPGRPSIRTAPGGPCRHSSGHDSPPFSLPTLPPSTSGVPA
ncbi:MAG: hypothetical protein ACK5GZ_09980 [Cyanobium sp.]